MSDEIELRRIAASLEEIDRKYDLATQGLKSGSTGVGLGFAVAMFTVAIAAVTHLFGEQPLFTGNQVLWVIGVVVGGLLVYFAMVYSREFVIGVKISKTRKDIDVALGKTVE